MPTMKLTAVAVERLKPDPRGRVEYFDAALPAFGLRITPTGHRSWIYLYRHGGRSRRLTLGSYPKIGLKEARDKARQAAADVADGHDPALERQEKRAEAGTVAAVAEQFIELYAKRRQRSWRVTKQYLDRDVIPYWGRRPIDSISRGDVLALLDKAMAEGKETKANRLHGHLRKLFRWCVERGWVEVSPVADVSAPGKAVKRDRVLSDKELAAIWEACGPLGHPFGGLVRLLILTAQRREEAANMRWSDLDLESKVWRLPREITKSDRTHEVPLANMALEVLEASPQIGDYVFVSGRRGDQPVTGWSVAKRRLDKLADVEDWRLHDIRRTAASGMARLNVPPHVLGRVLNHVPYGGGVLGVYDRYAYEPEKRHALEGWARHLISLIKPAKTNVVELASRADAN